MAVPDIRREVKQFNKDHACYTVTRLSEPERLHKPLAIDAFAALAKRLTLSQPDIVGINSLAKEAQMFSSLCNACKRIFKDDVIWANDCKCPHCGAEDWKD
ncbi:MAG: hypothetical protein C9356_15230 [Oleiphilus sp.]|nr:MAG: hypothetical protein C9356_15230 [Oleiphilus sp.]